MDVQKYFVRVPVRGPPSLTSSLAYHANVTLEMFWEFVEACSSRTEKASSVLAADVRVQISSDQFQRLRDMGHICIGNYIPFKDFVCDMSAIVGRKT